MAVFRLRTVCIVPSKREDTKDTYRLNLDYDINDNSMMYASITTGHRAEGITLVFFSKTASYDPEELTAYELGYKTQWLDNSLQLNGSIYLLRLRKCSYGCDRSQ